jgi:hypothetical protein
MNVVTLTTSRSVAPARRSTGLDVLQGLSRLRFDVTAPDHFALGVEPSLTDTPVAVPDVRDDFTRRRRSSAPPAERRRNLAREHPRVNGAAAARDVEREIAAIVAALDGHLVDRARPVVVDDLEDRQRCTLVGQAQRLGDVLVDGAPREVRPERDPASKASISCRSGVVRRHRTERSIEPHASLMSALRFWLRPTDGLACAALELEHLEEDR